MKKKILLLVLLAGSIFLFAPTNKAEAAYWQCQSAWGPGKDALCTDKIQASSYSEAKTKCDAWCVDKDKCSLPLEGQACPLPQNFGCYKNVAGALCENVSAVNPDVADFKCKALCKTGEQCTRASEPCLPLKEYACTRDGVCEHIKETTAGRANAKCRAPCEAEPKQNQKCDFSEENVCTPEKPGPLAGTSAEDLQKEAASGLFNLNKAKLGTPVTLINRAIRGLMAFIGSIALVLYIYAGFLWMTASGNAEQVNKAKTTMVWTTLGAAIMLASYMLASFILGAIPK